MSLETHDALEIRCPHLGGEVPFKYCRTVQENLPCSNMVRCWQGRLDVIAFLAENYSPEVLEQAFGRPRKHKLERILDIVERVKRDQSESPQ